MITSPATETIEIIEEIGLLLDSTGATLARPIESQKLSPKVVREDNPLASIAYPPSA